MALPLPTAASSVAIRLAQLALGDVRLGFLEALSDLLLREPGGAARLPQPGEKGPIPLRVD